MCHTRVGRQSLMWYEFCDKKDNPTAPTAGETFTLASSTPVTSTTLTYNSGTNSFSGFPATANVTVRTEITTSYVAGSTIPYIEGATVSFNGTSFVMSRIIRNGDVINISNNANGSGIIGMPCCLLACKRKIPWLLVALVFRGLTVNL